MIITCNNCNKKFDIDSSLIPDEGRLLQCASCDHKWFFKKEVLENTSNPIDEDTSIDSINIFDQNNPTNKEKINPPNLSEEEAVVGINEELNKKIEVNNEEQSGKKIDAKQKKKKNFKILNIFIVIIISFVAFIIIVDTFKSPIGKIVPNVEFILYNLYESIKDISLFIRDLM
ncbi:zinc-ribbon domain-containing protein [Candidatus Pelagibacter sp.]|nr:zinc-ribbon domain-containing protein [Candidatus Pelagibacter sp.]